MPAAKAHVHYEVEPGLAEQVRAWCEEHDISQTVLWEVLVSALIVEETIPPRLARRLIRAAKDLSEERRRRPKGTSDE